MTVPEKRGLFLKITCFSSQISILHLITHICIVISHKVFSNVIFCINFISDLTEKNKSIFKQNKRQQIIHNFLFMYIYFHRKGRKPFVIHTLCLIRNFHFKSHRFTVFFTFPLPLPLFKF